MESVGRGVVRRGGFNFFAVVLDGGSGVDVGDGAETVGLRLIGSRRAVITSSPPSRVTLTHVFAQPALCASSVICALSNPIITANVKKAMNNIGLTPRATLPLPLQSGAPASLLDQATLREESQASNAAHSDRGSISREFPPGAKLWNRVQICM